MDNEFYIGLDGSTATRFHLYQDQRQTQVSCESQWVSTGSGPLAWTGGLFWFTEKNKQPTRQDILATGGVSTLRQETVATALYGQVDYSLTPVYKATLGARYSHET